MRERIIGELDHAMQDLARNFEHFVPRLLAMLIIALLGWVVAYVLKVSVRGILRVAKFDKLSDNAGTTQLLNKLALPSSSELLCLACVLDGVDGLHSARSAGARDRRTAGVHLKILPLLAQTVRGAVHCLFRIGRSKLFSRAALLAAVNADSPSPGLLATLIRTIIVIFASNHGLRAAWPRREDNPGRLRDCLRGLDARPCYCLWHGWPGSGKAIPGEKIPKEKRRSETGRTLAAVTSRCG